jgi:phosphoserine phosphatase
MTESVPLIVDLDGTLIDGDSLHLSLGVIVRRRPWLVPILPFVTLRGRAPFKQFVSNHATLDPASLPYRRDVLDFVQDERTTGRRVILATAANVRIAESVAAHLRLFDSVIASDRRHNAKGDGKLAAIRATLGSAEFDYVGDSMADVPVFRVARRSYLVAPEPALVAAVRDGGRLVGVFGVQKGAAAQDVAEPA